MKQHMTRGGGLLVGAVAVRMLPGLVIAGLGGAMLLLSQAQPAFLGENFGPGLLARVLALGVIALGCAWALILAGTPAPDGARDPAAACGGRTVAGGLRWSGPALLAAVLMFALAVPVAGMVVAAGLAAALAAWGAGERGAVSLAGTVLGLMGLVTLVGIILLPPTAPLWPRL